jgi:DNA polymerase-3 subunit epsilon
MIENVLIIDTETTGLSPDKGSKLIEIAAILFNIKHKTPLQSYSTLLPCEENPVENINHIKASATKSDFSLGLMDSTLKIMADCAQACVAHNADFDRRFVATLPVGKALLEMKWICTKANFTWPVALQRLRLQDICHAMKVPYVNAHRALTDCFFIAQCFEKVEDLDDRINRC